MEVVLGILFLTFSSGNIQFAEKEFTWKSYIITDALLTIKQVKPINKNIFTQTALDENFERFVIYVAALETLLSGLSIHPEREV